MTDISQFDDFWQASSLDQFNIQKFAAQLSGYDSDSKELQLDYPLSAVTLPKTKGTLNRIAKKRVSDRTFSSKPLSKREVSRVLSSFYAWNGLEHRGFPSAGATYTTEVFCVTFNIEGAFNAKVLYYDPASHGLVTLPIKPPNWKDASKSLNIEIVGEPQMLLLFVSFPSRAIAKYGERGGRFMLLEAGAAMQQLALQLAASKNLKGVAAGGLLDSTWLKLLNLEDKDACLTLGYLVGK
jgi:SagB-type dehydrogenase family enzyme